MEDVMALLSAFRQGDEHAEEKLVAMFAGLLQQAQYDSLTGLSRLAYTLTRLQQEGRRAQRYGTPLCVAMLDIDHFKQCNTAYGHVQGNAVLVRVADIVRSEIRQSDLAGRFGGDELCLVLPETPLDKAYTVAERIRHRIAEAVFRTPYGVPFYITVSLGIAPWRADVQDVTTLLAHADAALYRAKATRNRVVMAPERVASPNGGYPLRRLYQDPREREQLFVVPGEILTLQRT
jgi:diguanylate cyclase (GGDEF)-like protein